MNQEFLESSLYYFCKANALPFMSASDLLYGKIVTTTAQNVWLKSYIEIWEDANIWLSTNLTILLLFFTFILFNMPSQSNNNSQRLTEVSNNVREANARNSITNSGKITVTKYYKPWRTLKNY